MASLLFTGTEESIPLTPNTSAPTEWVSDSLPLIDQDTGKVVSTIQEEVPVNDTSKVKKNPNRRKTDASTQPVYISPFFLKNPQNFQTNYELDEDGEGYTIREQIGEIDIRYPSRIGLDDYIDYRQERGISDYFRQLSTKTQEELRQGLLPSFDLGPLGDVFWGAYRDTPHGLCYGEFWDRPSTYG